MFRPPQIRNPTAAAPFLKDNGTPFVSRSRAYRVLQETSKNSTFVRKLFELEVPEVGEGMINIKNIVREAGYKTKLAVESSDTKVDPIGACVGVRGSRIRNIIDELNGEKIDILKWEDQPEVMVAASLKPAQINSITLNYDTKTADVLVEEDQLSLAIGRRGANVRLASRLSGWDIQISGEKPIEDPALAAAARASANGEAPMPESADGPDPDATPDPEDDAGGSAPTGAAPTEGAPANS